MFIGIKQLSKRLNKKVISLDFRQCWNKNEIYLSHLLFLVDSQWRYEKRYK